VVQLFDKIGFAVAIVASSGGSLFMNLTLYCQQVTHSVLVTPAVLSKLDGRPETTTPFFNKIKQMLLFFKVCHRTSFPAPLACRRA
jgi:hypothetical protein